MDCQRLCPDGEFQDLKKFNGYEQGIREFSDTLVLLKH